MGRGQELLNAAREGDKRTVERILGQITNISGPFTSLRRGAGVNVQDDNGYTPLHQACLNGRKEIVRVLLAAGASPCMVDKKGATPLHLAAFKGDTDICYMLLEHSQSPVNIDQLTSDHETALLIAAQFGFVNVVSQLISRGADVTIKNSNDESALDLAAQYGRLATVQHLLQVRPQLVDQYRYPACRSQIFTNTPLHRASKNGRKDVVTALIDAGMDPNVRTHSGTPLHEAARFGKPSVVRILLNKGADLHAHDSSGKTVYHLFEEYPEEATRKVRKVIREYDNIMGAFDSDKELPPFPVPDYSPDAVMTYSNVPPMLNAKMLSTKPNASLTKCDDYQKDSVINATNKLPPSEYGSQGKLYSNSLLNVDVRERSESFVIKARNNKQLKILGNAIKSDTTCSELMENQNQLISEFKSRNKSKAGPESEKEVGALQINDFVDFKSTSPTREFGEKIRRCTMDQSSKISLTDASDTNSLTKKKPFPNRRPVTHAPKFTPKLDEDYVDSLYVNKFVAKTTINYVADNIYENVSKNLPDDEKVKSESIQGCVQANDYISMDGKPPTEITYTDFDKHDTYDIPAENFKTFCEKTDTNNTLGYIQMVNKNQHKRMSNPDISSCQNKTELVHLRGDFNCIYGSLDYLYIYELNPSTVRGNVHPFTKTKHKAKPMPCYCHEDPEREKKIQKRINGRGLGGSQLVYYSCEDIYEPMKNSEGIYTSLNDLSSFSERRNTETVKSLSNASPTYVDDFEGKVLRKFSDEPSFSTGPSESNKQSICDDKISIIKKKTIQAKQFFFDWTTTETQKNTNNNDSFISPSSSALTKNHPQSFVKKFASKCLGLKAKFNSAPNITNSVAAEATVKPKQSEFKSNSNTILIGNSKFFKMLSKKEDSGEIVCNDEFDTISLDRLGTLNRDSVVNRSNRSCPGFKTSLPNISENNELSGSEESIAESVVITELDCDRSNVNINEAINNTLKLNIFEPREKNDRQSVTSIVSAESTNLVNECYESYEFVKKDANSVKSLSLPKPPPRPTVMAAKNSTENIYQNVIMEIKTIPKPAARVHIPTKPLDDAQKQTMYENIAIVPEKKPEPLKRSIITKKLSNESFDEKLSNRSRSSTLSSDSMIDESNLEDILLSEKSKSFRHGVAPTYSNMKLKVPSTQSVASDSSDSTEASALENVDCSLENDEKPLYLSMTGTLPNKRPDSFGQKKVLFRHKTFTNIELDRNSLKVKDLPPWNNSFLKETLAHYHIRGTGHCIYKAPTVQEFIYIFNRDTLYKDVPPFTKVPNDKRDSYFETAICFCRPKPPKFHSSAEDLIDKTTQAEDEKVTIDIDALRSRYDMLSSSFQCYCESGNCTLHSTKRNSPVDLVVKFSAIKRSISTPDITLETTPYSTATKSHLPKNKSVPDNLEEPYAVVTVEDIIARNSKISSENKEQGSPIYTLMSQFSTLSSTTSGRPYSVKDISDVISLTDNSTSSTLSHASGVHLPIRKSSSSEYSGHMSLYSCKSDVTVKSDTSFKSCIEDSSEDSDSTLHSDGEEDSDAETIKSDGSTTKRPWVQSNSFRFGSRSKPEIDVIVEENTEEKSEVSSSIHESGICLEGSESSSSEGEDDSGIPRVDADVSLGCASLERVSGMVGGVRSGSARRRWDEAEGTSEGDALSVSSAASSCAPLLLAHHHEYSKVSPTPPKKPPRRNLSVSPTHANSPSSGYSYELRPHARSQDDLDDIQGAKHYLKHGRSVDQYVDGKLSYSEYEENHNSPRVVPIPNPRPSLKQRSQPVAITAMYENIVIKEQNPRRKLRRNNFVPNDSYEPRMNDNRVRKYSNQEKSSLESLLDDQSMNSPSDCERYYDGHRAEMPLSPTHYEQPPTPDHPPPSAKQAENCIHERIRPLSQEYKRRSGQRDSQTETDIFLLRAASAASVASGATDRSGNTDNCVEEYVCDVPFAGLFKGSTTTLDGIGLRPMPAERPKTLRKLKSVYDASPTEPAPPPAARNGAERSVNVNGEDEVRRRSNTTSSTQSGEKSLSILSPFDEQEEWAKISEIMASFGSKLVRESVFVSELEQEFTSRLGLSCSESSLSPSVASSLGLWLSGMGLHDYETLFLESGFDDIDFVNGILDENDLREMGIEENDRQKILESAKQLPLKITEISNNHNNNNISKNQNESVEEWLKHINLEQYSDTFRKHLYVDMDRVRRIWEVELTAVLEIQKAGHRKRILASVSGEHNGPANHMEDINADLNTLKNNIQQLKEEIKEKLPPSENLKPVPPPVVPTLAPPGGETLKRSKKNRPAPQPPRPSDLEIRAPSELLVGVPGALKTQWKHQPFVLVTGAVTYVANYLGSTVVKELRGTESTKKSIQKLKKSTKEPRDSPDIILSISYRGVKFLNTITRELVCEHEIRNIHCACQDADDLTHFAYITKDHASRSHYCHVFRVATMDQATEVILTLGEAFEVAYQMALREQSNRTRVTQSLAKTPTHDPMTTTNKEKPNVTHGRSHSITEIKLNGHQLKIAPLPASLSNEDFQAATRNSDGSKSPRTPLLKAPIASTEEL